MRDQVSAYIESLQDKIVVALESFDSNAPKFIRDSWLRPEGGKGVSCSFATPPSNSSPTALEKAGVNISIVHGSLPPPAIKQMRADHASLPYDPDSQASLPFFAAGISLIVHPRNPMAPTVHANYRYFEVTDEEGAVLAWWFGGGCDLTPSYLYEQDATEFHTVIKTACDKHSAAFYPAFKKWCDEYFYIPHRKESRGIGGIFYDDLCSEPHARLAGDTAVRPRSASEIFGFMQTCGDAFIPSYIPILQRRAWEPFTEHHRRWQLIRRGRYVEFNLIHDRGTKFGLMTPGARVESILMSLPETARWEYQSTMGSEEGSEEKRLVEVLTKPKEWAQM